MGKTSIEWTRGDDGSAGETWNPVTGCTKVSPGCDHCYAEKITERWHGKGSFAEVKLHPERLEAPLRWRKPRRVFVNSMSDLFHDKIPDEFIARVWAVMAATPQHTYQILTKRHGRMRSLVSHHTFIPAVVEAHSKLIDAQSLNASQQPWPLPNVHLGVSVEDQKRADLRIPALRETPAAVRFLSCEPLIAPVNIEQYLWLSGASSAGPFYDSAGRYRFGGGVGGQMITWVPAYDVGWCIIGGESGPGARPCDPEWIRDLVQQCQRAEVPVFVKQLGSVWARENGGDSKGGDPRFWPVDLRVREFPVGKWVPLDGETIRPVV